MASTILDLQGKKDSQIFIENLQRADPAEVDRLFNPHNFGEEPTWHRFVKGAYSHPVTWWVGLLQIQMQMGIWGHSRQAQAQLRSNTVSRALSVVWDNASLELIQRVLVYNLKHRKSEITGRLAGGFFTNYATTGGRIGNKNINNKVKAVAPILNFHLASYGSSIKSVARGYTKTENIIQSIITGRPDGPSPYPDISGYQYATQELKMLEELEVSLDGVNALTQIAPAPVPISEFCLRPENVNLEGLCK